MEKIKTLTVNGEAYQLWDGEAAHIDDSKVSPDTCWSGDKVIRQLCPAFTQTGSTVTCQPVEHSPLQVVSYIDPIQAGSGYASPDNVRPISGHCAVKLTRNDAEFTLDLGQEVYGGSFDWTSGVLTIDKTLVRVTSDIGWVMGGASNPNGIKSFYTSKKFENVYDSTVALGRTVSSHYLYYEAGWSVSSVAFPYAIKVLNSLIYIADVRFTDLESFKAFLDTENVQLLCFLKKPVTIQLTPQEVLALSGVNTLYSNTGNTTVTGKADPVAIIEKLSSAVTALLEG